ncbi:MAG TPA: hypothetical protein VGE52_20560, partial [Pirellulales bacterium]
QEGRGNDEIRAAVHFIQQQTAMKVFPAASKSALAKARAAIQKIKSNPTKAGYDAAMDDGARALTQVCSNLAKLMDNAQCPAKLRSSLIGLKAVSRELDEFGGGAKRTVPDGTQSAAILLLNKEFKRHVDAAEQFFPIVVEFLKKHKL